ncbi:MAG: guanylate kinase [Candidatus Parcubacteria bacterium]|nr:MAG: guanylate kinase [Candidatus Parcubacteria bacterium]
MPPAQKEVGASHGGARRAQRGLFVIVMGPSGAGKSTLVAAIREALPEVVYVPSVTTRAPRPNETPGKTYRFVSDAEFDRLAAQDAFLEWARYGGNRYGTLREDVVRGLGEGKVLLKEMEAQGVEQVLRALPREQVFLVFVDAGPWEVLRERITARAPMSEEELNARYARYLAETEWKQKADAVIANPDGALEGAKQEVLRVMRAVLAHVC